MGPQAGNGQDMSAAPLVLRTEDHALSQMAAAFLPRSFTEALEMATTLHRSGFLGEAVKTPQQALAIMMRGAELGIPPMQAFASLYGVHGRVGMYSDGMVALVKRSGRCRYFRRVEVTDNQATYETLRVGDPEPVRVTFTIADADRAGYLKQNPKYKSDPRAMLAARAKGILCKDVYPDVIAGLDVAETIADEPHRVIDADVLPLRPVAEVVQSQPGGAPRENDADVHGQFLAEIDATCTVAEIDAIGKRYGARFPDKASRDKGVGTAYNTRRKVLVEIKSAADLDETATVRRRLEDMHQGLVPDVLGKALAAREAELEREPA